MLAKEIKLLIDLGVGKTVDLRLREHGYDIKSVRDINPRMPDNEILKLAVSEKRMVVTMDKDFGDLVYNILLYKSDWLLYIQNPQPLSPCVCRLIALRWVNRF